MMSREDFLRLREICAEKGTEMTPGELEELLQEVTAVTIVDEPGIVTTLRKMREEGKDEM